MLIYKLLLKTKSNIFHISYKLFLQAILESMKTTYGHGHVTSYSHKFSQTVLQVYTVVMLAKKIK